MSDRQEAPWSEHAPLDADAFKSLARRWASTVTVVTGRRRGSDALDGFTATAFLTVSMDPPIVLVSATVASSAGALARECDAFTINLLAESQGEVASLFATPHERRGDAFAAVAHQRDPAGAALIDGALGAYSASARSLVDAGDHVLLLGDVTRIWLAATPSAPLLYADRAFRRLGAPV
jgi:flavin reductase (DIM6/NTAB) family NADH-FMN oxidoreductase RutF